MPGVESGAHRPKPTLFRVPPQRQFDVAAGGRPVQIGARVVSGAYHGVDLHLLNIGFPAVEAGLPAALVISAVANEHRVVSIGERVEKLVPVAVILYGVGRCGSVERTAHAGLAPGLGDLPVATGADAGRRIVGRASRGPQEEG